MKNLIITCLFVFVAGCTAVKSAHENYVLSSGSGKGLLLVSLTYGGSYSGYAMGFVEEGSQELKTVEIGTGTAILPPGMHDWDIEKRGLRGNTFAVELPEGNYEFVAWKVSSGGATVRSANPLSIKFKIKPGQANYVGNFHFIRKSGFGGMVTDVDVSQSDESDRDLQIIKTKYPAIDAQLITAGIAKGSSTPGLGGGSSTSITTTIFVP